MSTTKIRTATPEDLPAIHQLVAELAAFVNSSEKLLMNASDYERDMAAGYFEAIVAEREGVIVGTMLFFNAYSTWMGRMIYLEDFVLNAEYRRLGIGSELWEALKQIGRDRGCKLLKWQIALDNPEAVKFYQAQGADIEEDWLNGILKL